jgi:hypothetical protein
MAIPNELRAFSSLILARAFVCLLGLGAIAWGGYLLPIFWQEASANGVASELLKGHAVRPQLILEEAQKADAAEQSTLCDSIILRDAVVLRLNILSDSIAAGDRALINSGRGLLYTADRSVLSCAPTDAFAWLTLFWLDVGKPGFEQDSSAYLRLSYALAPNEGWIALRRSRLAIASFTRLPPDLADDAIDEFGKLVDTGALYPETTAIFASAAPAVQWRLIAQLKSVEQIHREIFTKRLRDEGFDIHIPDVYRAAPAWQ